ncbi:DUF2848 domain-containing protein [Azoarcus sp. TTM-91]|uniref:DUF2848 domain-containing protein n=1 Tax=Azoarcus sp. TTM-91 TaxID=2691581 RepID=UPI00145D348F|nr:DUF2848 domain-containing protein [Azoarcus sp. TTM-91]NMG32885.1 DUF2848 domain-containing protein [Azoarcus sp. TTM-91]
MKLHFTLETDGGSRPLEADIRQLVIAGWAGRDRAAIEHHIEELAEIGVPRPSSVPLYYRVAANQVTQDATIQVVGGDSSGEVEAFVFKVDGELYLSIASDHTDRKLEAHSVALSKQICVKPVATTAWRLADVAGHWDELQVRSRIIENGAEVLYQDGTLASLRTAEDLIAGYTGGKGLEEGTGMTCGTVAVIGGIRPAATFEMELHDPRSGRSIRHRYTATVLPEVA